MKDDELSEELLGYLIEEALQSMRLMQIKSLEHIASELSVEDWLDHDFDVIEHFASSISNASVALATEEAPSLEQWEKMIENSPVINRMVMVNVLSEKNYNSYISACGKYRINHDQYYVEFRSWDINWTGRYTGSINFKIEYDGVITKLFIDSYQLPLAWEVNHHKIHNRKRKETIYFVDETYNTPLAQALREEE